MTSTDCVFTDTRSGFRAVTYTAWLKNWYRAHGSGTSGDATPNCWGPRTLLNFSPNVSLSNGIRRAVAWRNEWSAHAEVRAKTS